MTAKLNPVCKALAEALIADGSVVLGDDFAFTPEDQAAAAANPDRYYLGEYAGMEGAARWAYPVGAFKGDAFLVHEGALKAIREISGKDPEVFAAAGALLALLVVGAAGDGVGAEDEPDNPAAGGGIAQPGGGDKPPGGTEPIHVGQSAAPLTDEQKRAALHDGRKQITAADIKAAGTDNRLTRSYRVRAEAIDVEKRTVELSFSSEEPCERWGWIEILEHSAGAVRLGRLNDAAAFLVDHATRDQVGVIERAWLSNRKGRALVRFGRSARAQEIFADIIDGIRQHTSVGYWVHSEILAENVEGQLPVYRVTDWEPLEISIVPVPADPGVGVGRAVAVRHLNDKEAKKMADETPTPVKAPEPDVKPYIRSGEEKERARQKKIRDGAKAYATHPAFGEAITALAERCCEAGTSYEEFAEQSFLLMAERKGETVRQAPNPELGMPASDIKRYSLLKVCRFLDAPNSIAAKDEAAFELEASFEARKLVDGKSADGVTVPQDIVRAVLGRSLGFMAAPRQRDLNVTDDTAGGYLVKTELGQLIEMLVNRAMVVQMGATVLGGLNGNLAFPKQTGGATCYIVGEGIDVTESQQTFGEVALTPFTLGALTEITRRALKQSSIDIEALVWRDLAQAIQLEYDRLCIEGSGAGQPLGILNHTDFNVITPATNGEAVSWADACNVVGNCAVDNAPFANSGWLTNAKVMAALLQTAKATGLDFMMQPIRDPQGFFNLMGYRLGVSNQVPWDLTQGTSIGVCSALIFAANWSDLMIGQWGGIDLNRDTATKSASGGLRLVALHDMGVAIRHGQSFGGQKDITTTL